LDVLFTSDDVSGGSGSKTFSRPLIFKISNLTNYFKIRYFKLKIILIEEIYLAAILWIAVILPE
tara:strand:- start:133 stop:324 length:192 start_codon:yes stop_codon:yes gene_type:complete